MHYKVVPGFLSFPGYLSWNQRHTEIISGQAARSSQRDPCLRRNLWSSITSQRSLLWNSLHLCLSYGFSFMAYEGSNWAVWAQWSLLWQSSQMCTLDVSQTALSSCRPWTGAVQLGRTCNLVITFPVILLTLNQSINQSNKQINTQADR